MFLDSGSGNSLFMCGNVLFRKTKLFQEISKTVFIDLFGFEMATMMYISGRLDTFCLS